MPALRKRLLSRYLTDSRLPEPVIHTVHDFYREEFIKHQRCLQQQREYYSAQAIESVEAALVKVIAQVDALSTKEDANQVVAKLLREFDVVTRLSAWSDPHKAH